MIYIPESIFNQMADASPKGHSEGTPGDLLCWQCELDRLGRCPHTATGRRPPDGRRLCADWFTNAHVEYGDSPRNKAALRRLLSTEANA